MIDKFAVGALLTRTLGGLSYAYAQLQSMCEEGQNPASRLGVFIWVDLSSQGVKFPGVQQSTSCSWHRVPSARWLPSLAWLCRVRSSFKAVVGLMS
ncbi:hypothetical protein VTK73DRAFT_5898 [Phialemonium thermophilum]|uniref:Uncharacterized protein n=1 Tax=Phialemonium thermophilum TaxID=223376 RepID=A0ABR3WL78_9PEZI